MENNTKLSDEDCMELLCDFCLMTEMLHTHIMVPETYTQYMAPQWGLYRASVRFLFEDRDVTHTHIHMVPETLTHSTKQKYNPGQCWIWGGYAGFPRTR